MAYWRSCGTLNSRRTATIPYPETGPRLDQPSVSPTGIAIHLQFPSLNRRYNAGRRNQHKHIC
jgi:hypothetical protein